MIKKHRVQVLFCFIGFAISSLLQMRTLIDFLPSQTTSFANHQPDLAFQVSETVIFIPDFCKASSAVLVLYSWQQNHHFFR
jgi:hypothetical protein